MMYLGAEYERLLQHLGAARGRLERSYDDLVMAQHKGFGPDGQTADELAESIAALDDYIADLERRLDHQAWDTEGEHADEFP